MAAMSVVEGKHEDLADEIDEYFRKKFRKIEFAQAHEIILCLSQGK